MKETINIGMNKIKVLAVTTDDANRFHRFIYPFDKIKGTEFNGFEFQIDYKEYYPEILKEAEDYNIFIYHWDITSKIQDLANLQAKGVKIIYSLDDFWEFSPNHPYFNNELVNSYTANRVKQHILNADAVIVTTERLAIQVMKYADNVAILPNYLDPKDYNLEKPESDKLQVGIIGSISHVPDWQLIKGAINRFSKNKKIAENVEFVVCGNVEGDKNWESVLKLFNVKKNLNLKVYNALSATEYMSLYNNLDVCLMPLEYTEFNVCKSALKLMECGISKTLPVGSVLYSSKELKGIVVAEEPIQYEQTIEKLLDKDYYNQILNYITDLNLKDADVEKRIENTKATLVAVYQEDLKAKLDNVVIKTITYDTDQTSEYEIYDNSNVRTLEQKSWRFEYNPIIDAVSNLSQDVEYLGIFSWKFPLKTGFSKNILYKTLNHYKYKDYDLINVGKSYWKDTREFLQFSYKYHPKLQELLKKVLVHLNKDIYPDDNNYTYSNFFIMKADLWKDYVENWVKPALEFMENDPEYFEDAKYITGLPTNKLQELTGLDHYTYHTFVLERLILYFIADKKLKVKSVI